MTDSEFSTHFDANEIIRQATRRIADHAESALCAAVAAELRRQGWMVVPPPEPHTPTDDDRTSEEQEEQRHGDRDADHEEQQTDDRAATRRLGVAGSHASSMPQATSDGKRVISHTPTDDEREALGRILESWAGPWMDGQRPALYDLLVAGGFHRTEVPEPQVTERHDLVMPIYEDAPTDDEREAMRRIIAQGSYSRHGDDPPYADVADRLATAGFGFRRADKGAEPECEHGSTLSGLCAYARHRGELDDLEPGSSEPQGEPSDAEIDAAARAMFAITNQLSMSGAGDLARAALRAAGGVR